MTALLVTGDAHLVDAISDFENWLLFHDFSCLKKSWWSTLGELISLTYRSRTLPLPRGVHEYKD
jgi:hypothetical protein